MPDEFSEFFCSVRRFVVFNIQNISPLSMRQELIHSEF